MSVESTLRKADKYLKRGDFGDAAQLYLDVLTQFPGNKRAQNGIASIEKLSVPVSKAQSSQAHDSSAQLLAQQLNALQTLFAQNAFAQVVAEGRKLARLHPNSAELLNLIGLAHGRLGQHEQAIELFTQVRGFAPDHIDAQINLSASLALLEQYEQAIDAVQITIKRAPEIATPYLHLAFCTARLSRWEDSLKACQQVLEFDPNNASALVGAGHAALSLLRHDEALAYFHQAHLLVPDEVKIVQNIAITLLTDGRADELVTFLVPLLDRFAGDRDIMLHLSEAYLALNRPDLALPICQKLEEREPENSMIWVQLAACYELLGDTDKLHACRKTALDLDPDSAITRAQYYQSVPPAPDDPEFTKLQRQFDEADIPATERSGVGFVLFDIHDRNGDTEKAFATLVKANVARAEIQPYNLDWQLALFDALKQQFSEMPDQLDAASIDSITSPHRPVFIVGMPRSGTSLVEQILASHSLLFGAGELQFLGHALRDLGWKRDQAGHGPDQDTLRHIRQSYFDRLTRLETDAPVISDKSPMNFRWIGHALLAIPEARVLFMRRDSRATCWSNYSHSFTGAANNFGNDIGDLTRMYRAHLDLMDFWMQRFPGRIQTVRYEHLTEDQEVESRKLIDFIGLDWEEACLDFHKTKRAIRTASSDQVKQKMYTGSSEAWRRYEQYLGPMLEGLEGLD